MSMSSTARRNTTIQLPRCAIPAQSSLLNPHHNHRIHHLCPRMDFRHYLEPRLLQLLRELQNLAIPLAFPSSNPVVDGKLTG